MKPSYRDPAESGSLHLYYKDWRPTLLGRITTRLWTWLTGLGIMPAVVTTLLVKDQQTGRLVGHVLVPITLGERTFLVSMLGEGSHWVRDVRAAAGAALLKRGRAKPVVLIEVPVAERASILKAWCQIAASGRQHIPVAPDAPVSAFEAVAADFPVFQVLGRPSEVQDGLRAAKPILSNLAQCDGFRSAQPILCAIMNSVGVVVACSQKYLPPAGRRSGPSVRLDLDRIRSAALHIAPVFRNTPQYMCPPLGEALGCELILKLETANPIRCFKGRGTETVMAHLAGSGYRAAVCASAGNLGQALAYSGRSRGISTIVVAASKANPYKLERMRALGATVRIVDGDFEDARHLARQVADSEGAFLVEDSENIDTCEGAGTIGLELLDGVGPVDAVLIALGGGAMATGIGHVFKCLAPQVEIVGVQPKGAPAMALSWRTGAVVETDGMDTIADGVAGRFPIPEVLEDLLVVADDVTLVEEDSIIAGMRLLYRHAGLVVEPSAALGIAAILEDRPRYRGKRIATIICGGNVIPADFERWVIEQA